MRNVEVQKANESEKASMPIFEKLAKKFDEVRHRAFDLFEKRGCEDGHGLEDWLKAEEEVLGLPAAEFTDKGSAYELQIALPGFEPKDVEVTAIPGEIIVHAASKQEKKSEDSTVLWTEFSSSDLYRWFPLPGTIDSGKTTATLEKGLLRISAPKASEVKQKSIEAKAA